MQYLWPDNLWLMALVPLLPALYAWLLRRRAKAALRYSSLGIVRAAVTGRQWRRHLPPALLLVAFAGLLLASSRPTARVSLPWARTTVVLAIDVSLSMRVADVQPTRMEAAQEAAKLFLRDLPPTIEVALVTFAGSSQVAQAATLDRSVLVEAIDGFQMQVGTAVGNAIAMSVAELFPDHGIDLTEMSFGSSKPRGRGIDEPSKPAPKPLAPVAPGSYPSAAIILLSDGRRTTGIDTLEAAKLAAERGVRIDVVGLGTVAGETRTDEGMPIYMQLDEPTLREVARMTGGQYHHAGTAEKLRDVYANLGSRVQLETRDTELAPLLALAAALVAALAAGLSVHWHRRLA